MLEMKNIILHICTFLVYQYLGKLKSLKKEDFKLDLLSKKTQRHFNWNILLKYILEIKEFKRRMLF
jgi:hypothetical protein